MEVDSNGVYMVKPVPNRKREVSLLRRLEIEEVKAVSLSKQLEELAIEFKEVQQVVSSISNEVAVATARASADTLDSYRY